MGAARVLHVLLSRFNICLKAFGESSYAYKPLEGIRAFGKNSYACKPLEIVRLQALKLRYRGQNCPPPVP